MYPERLIHRAPSHSQVSFRPSALNAAPPKTTVRPRAESKAIAGEVRAPGPTTERAVQVLPLHSQVSLICAPVLLPMPPNTTVRARALSYTMPHSDRAGGPPLPRRLHPSPI